MNWWRVFSILGLVFAIWAMLGCRTAKEPVTAKGCHPGTPPALPSPRACPASPTNSLCLEPSSARKHVRWLVTMADWAQDMLVCFPSPEADAVEEFRAGPDS